MTSMVYVNGRFLAPGEASIPVSDAGFLHGTGLFETLRAENGKVFRWEKHVARLKRSADLLMIPLDPQPLPDHETIRELLARNGMKVARVRITVSAGQMSMKQTPAAPRATVVATAAPIEGYPSATYRQGVCVSICDYRLSPSDPLAGHKTTCYFPRLLGLRQAHQRQCVEALWFTTANRLAEGCLSNVFLVKDATLKTPPLDTPVLPGIARGVVLEVAAKLQIPVSEQPLLIDDLLEADELFLTNSIMQVMPVIRVERHDVREGRVGPLTRRLLEAYRDLVKEECRSA